jgi:predicted nucleic acid-binding protein
MEGIVIDTNVFVAAGFNPRSASARILTGIREGRFRLTWNEPTRRETEMILRRIPRLDWDKVAALPTGREIYWVGRSRRLRIDPGP